MSEGGVRGIRWYSGPGDERWARGLSSFGGSWEIVRLALFLMEGKMMRLEFTSAVGMVAGRFRGCKRLPTF